MPLGYTNRLDAFTVFFGWISLVCIPSIVWGFVVKFLHKIISFGFCEYRCGCNIEKASIPFDHAFVWDFEIGRKAIAVDKNIFWWGIELLNSEVHGLDRGIEDIDFIDSFGEYMGNAVGDGNTLDFFSQFGSLFGSQFFGIGKRSMRIGGGKDHSSSRDRPCQATPTSLIGPTFNKLGVLGLHYN